MATQIETMLNEADIPVEFEDAREEALVRLAANGQDVQAFLDSPAGRFVIGCAVQESVELEQAMARCSTWGPLGRRKLRRLQQKHAAIELSIGWLTEAVRLGIASERQLEADQYTE